MELFIEERHGLWGVAALLVSSGMNPEEEKMVVPALQKAGLHGVAALERAYGRPYISSSILYPCHGDRVAEAEKVSRVAEAIRGTGIPVTILEERVVKQY